MSETIGRDQPPGGEESIRGQKEKKTGGTGGGENRLDKRIRKQERQEEKKTGGNGGKERMKSG